MPVLPRTAQAARSPSPPFKPPSPLIHKAPFTRWRLAAAVRAALLLPFFVVAFAGYRFFASGGETAQTLLGERIAVTGHVAQAAAEDALRTANIFAERDVVDRRAEAVGVENAAVGESVRSEAEAVGGDEKEEIVAVGGEDGEVATAGETTAVGEGIAAGGDNAAGEASAVGDSVDGEAAAAGESVTAGETTAAGEGSSAGGDRADGEASAVGDTAASGENTVSGEGSAAGGDSAAGETAAAGESTSAGEEEEKSAVGKEKNGEPAFVAVETDQDEVEAGEGGKADGEASIAGAGEGEASIAGAGEGEASIADAGEGEAPVAVEKVDNNGESGGEGKGVATVGGGEVQKDVVAVEDEKESGEVVATVGGGDDAASAKEGEKDSQETEQASDVGEVVAKGDNDGPVGKDADKGEVGEKENSDVLAENEREVKTSEKGDEELRLKKEQADLDSKDSQASVDEEPKIDLNEASIARIAKEAGDGEESDKKADDAAEVAGKTSESVASQAVEEKSSEAPAPASGSETGVSDVLENVKGADKPLSEQSAVEIGSKVENQDAKAAGGGDLAISESKSEDEIVADKGGKSEVIEGKGPNVPEATKDETVAEAVEDKLVPSNEIKTEGEIPVSQSIPAEIVSQGTLRV